MFENRQSNFSTAAHISAAGAILPPGHTSSNIAESQGEQSHGRGSKLAGQHQAFDSNRKNRMLNNPSGPSVAGGDGRSAQVVPIGHSNHQLASASKDQEQSLRGLSPSRRHDHEASKNFQNSPFIAKREQHGDTSPLIGKDLHSTPGILHEGTLKSLNDKISKMKVHVHSIEDMGHQARPSVNYVSQQLDQLQVQVDAQRTKPRISFGYKFNTNRNANRGAASGALGKHNQSMMNGLPNTKNMTSLAAMPKKQKHGNIAEHDEARTLAARFLHLGSQDMERNSLHGSNGSGAMDSGAVPHSHRSKIFESKKLSVLNIATRINDHVAQYKTILG